jgi:hypothetical protein
VQFSDVSNLAGISFTHTNGASRHYFLVETMGGGGAFFDYDLDGDLDIYLVDGFDLQGYRSVPMNLAFQEGNFYWIKNVDSDAEQRSHIPKDYAVNLTEPVERPGNVLYRNNGDGTFAATGPETGVDDRGYGMGCAVADYDNDGSPDLYVTNYGANVLYRNNDNGTFTNTTDGAGTAAPQWSASAAFFDYENDGDLDLYIANYLDFAIETNKVCGGIVKTKPNGLKAVSTHTRSYCAPKDYQGVPDVLYRNNGDGTFDDVSIEAGIADPAGKGLGVVAWDFDRDGAQDLFVANDGTPNFLYHNKGDGTFVDVALEKGVAHNEAGESEAGMGVDLGDYDNDGDFDLFVTNFSHQTNTLYRNEGTMFKDATAGSGLGEPSWRYLGFGTAFLDYDHDGDLDLYVANGHVLDKIALFQSGVEYEQEHQLFRNDGSGNFAEVSRASGAWFLHKQVSRGTALGDFDGDGDLDLLVTNCGGPAKLVRNDGGNRGNWLIVETVGTRSNRDGVGALVKIIAGDLVQMRQVRSGFSYLSASDLRLHFGLGSRDAIDRVEVKWPSGTVQYIKNVSVNQHLVVREQE